MRKNQFSLKVHRMSDELCLKRLTATRKLHRFLSIIFQYDFKLKFIFKSGEKTDFSKISLKFYI